MSHLEVKVGTELQGRYVVSHFLGDGGYGIVWRATDKHEGRDVAIKRMKSLGGDERESLIAEAKKIAALKGHKNIVELYDTFDEGGEQFLVMEYVDGKSLHDIFQSHARARTWLDPDDALDYFQQILDGLSFAHSHAMFHRDIKPSNILVSKLDVIKLVDFGLAKSMIGTTEVGGNTGFGARTGTASFMSPETALGKPPDHRTDIFSAGLVGYILLTGKHPFNHLSGAFSIFDLIKETTFDCEPIRPAHVKGLSESACTAINSMLSKDRDQRCQSVQRILQELTKDTGKVCSQCGASNKASAVYCDQCGTPLKLERPPQATDGLSATTLTDEGFQFTREDNWESAITSYRKAIEADKSYARAYGNLSYALNKLGKHEDAIAVCTQGLDYAKTNTERHRLYDNRGFGKSRLKDFQGAIEDFTAAIKLNVNNPKVYYHRGESYAFAGDFKSALNDASQALTIDSEFLPALRLTQRLKSQGLV